MLRFAPLLVFSFLCSAEGGDRPATPATAADTADTTPLAAADSVALQAWPVPWVDTRPRDPDVDGSGRVWFVGQTGDYVAWLDPASGEFQRHDLPAGAGPHNLVVAEDGGVWYAGNRAAHIGRLDPATGEIVQVPMPDPAARDPHTLAIGPDGEIWFTVQGGNFVGRLDPEMRDVRLIAVPTPDARPYGIVVAPDGRPWFVEFGSHKIGTVDPSTMELREIPLPRTTTRPRRLGLASDGAVWYVDFAEGFVGRLDAATGAVEEWQAPSGERALPYAMAIDDRDRIWFVETGPRPNRLVGFDPSTETFLDPRPIPSSGNAVRHMVFHAPESELWFGTDGGAIVRARLY